MVVVVWGVVVGGGLKGRDLSGLDCVLIEVTCIKWNLIGTDTGSLTDRHDADGLKERTERVRETVYAIH